MTTVQENPSMKIYSDMQLFTILSHGSRSKVGGTEPMTFHLNFSEEPNTQET